VFISHLHMDHTLGLAALLFYHSMSSEYLELGGGELPVYGPGPADGAIGIRELIDHLRAAFSSTPSMYQQWNNPPEGPQVHPIEIKPGIVYRDSAVTVTAFEVTHKTPIAFGFRVQTADGVIVISGDTRPVDAVVDACNGCDLLFHELSGLEFGPNGPQGAAQGHTSAEELGVLAQRARPKHLVIYHDVQTPHEAAQLRISKSFHGKVTFARDLDVFSLSDNDNGVVTGRVTSIGGQAIIGVRVAAVPVSESNGSSVGSIVGGIALTDSSGNYRLENIPPGRYKIKAGPADSPTYFPGVTDQSLASVVTISGAADIGRIDFAMLPAGRKVSGRVTGTASLASLILVPEAKAATAVVASVKADGTFEFSNVPPGEYEFNKFSAPVRLVRPARIIVASNDITGVELLSLNTDATTRQSGLETAWSSPGAWLGMAEDDRTGLIYVSNARGITVFDRAGNPDAEMQNFRAAKLRLAHFSEFGEPTLLALGALGGAELRAYDLNGKELWRDPDPDINDFWATDLDGDKSDEIIVGSKGGVHVLNSKGIVLWKSTAIDQVTYVSAGNVWGQGPPQVVTSSNSGLIHVFSADLKERKSLDLGFNAEMVRTASVLGAAGPFPIVAGRADNGPSGNVVTLRSLPGDGSRGWSLNLESEFRTRITSAIMSPNKPLLAVGLQGGYVYVVDVKAGAVIASVDGQGMQPEVTWLSDNDTGAPLLVVRTGKKLNAYRVSAPK